MKKIDISVIFAEFLEKNGFVYTKQRKQILEVLLNSSTHLTVDGIRNQLEINGVVVSRGTFYNSLRIFSDAGLVSKLRSPRGRVYYEITEGINEYHEHMICKSCEKIIEIRDRSIENFFLSVCKDHGFRVTYRIHEIYGLCSSC